LTVKALGKDNVSLISMPSRFSSNHSKIDALQLAQNLECNFQTVDIDPIFQSYINLLGVELNINDQSIVFENIQSRIRANILMALSNNDNALVVATGNKTEIALGYSTIYGDMSGAILPIGDLTKIEVYNLCNYLNEHGNHIPQNILDKTPSAELSPNQVDPFDYDHISPIVDEFITSNHNSDLSNSFKKLILKNEFKRRQAPIILRVSSKSFGVGRRMPIINNFNE
jgi:NAD+ synthase (glutamine-hydrolysing)